MAVVYATLIVNGRRTFAQVPVSLKAEVAAILIDLGAPDLVPISYGGTMPD